MDKHSPKKAKTCGSPAPKRSRGHNIGTSEQSSGSAQDGPAGGPKRKASPEKKTLRKRTRVSELRHPNTSGEDVSVRGVKRKVREDREEPSKEKKKTRKSEQDKHVNETASTSTDIGTADFKAKYKELEQLGEGGCGSVFAGYRNKDNFPVAIKHVPKDKIFCKYVAKDGRELSVEVAVMLKLAAETKGSVGTSAPVSLLDWYDLDQELILVMERPIPSKDLLKYTKGKGGSLPEEEAKIILEQLVYAAIQLEKRRIFHRDIKLENILIESSSDVPRVRLIDFGLSCFAKNRSAYSTFYGTKAHIPPEWYNNRFYKAGPTTVWQLGIVLFEMLHSEVRFETMAFLNKSLRLNKELSKDCLDFLKACLAKDPKRRLTLEQLQLHPWLHQTHPTPLCPLF